MFDLYYTIPLLITFYAIWKLNFRFGTIWILLIIESLIMLSHPLAVGFFAFLLLFDYRSETSKPIKFYIPVILVFIGAAVFNFYMNIVTKSAQTGLIYTYVENKPYMLLSNLNNFKDIGFFAIRYFPEILAALILVIFMLVKTKQWIRLALVAITFLVVVIYINSNLNIFSGSLEEAMYSLFPIVFIPLIYGFPINRQQGLLNISILLISAVIAFRLAFIYYSSEIFVKRMILNQHVRKEAVNLLFRSMLLTMDIANLTGRTLSKPCCSAHLPVMIFQLLLHLKVIYILLHLRII